MKTIDSRHEHTAPRSCDDIRMADVSGPLIRFLFWLCFWMAALPRLLVPAHAFTQAQATACIGDAFKFCSQTMKDNGIVPDAIKACLRFNEKKLTPNCRASLRESK